MQCYRDHTYFQCIKICRVPRGLFELEAGFFVKCSETIQNKKQKQKKKKKKKKKKKNSNTPLKTERINKDKPAKKIPILERPTEILLCVHACACLCVKMIYGI